MSKQDLLKELFEKYLNDKTMTPAEIRQLRALVQDKQHQELLDQLLASLYEEETPGHLAAEGNSRVAFEEVWAKLQTTAPASSPDAAVVYMQSRRRWWKYVAAAIVLLTVAAGAYWLFPPDTSAPIVQQTPQPKTEIQPGSNKATLTLSDGSIIGLDTAQSGALAQQENVTIKKQEGQLIYDASHSQLTTHNSPTYNTITTPRGGRFHITLPDGSQVWLNAASSLHYPTAFNGAAREVTLTGEAYFEVAKNAAMPFRVAVNDMQVEVLGTHFNVMAYTDEDAINTTLLEGKVKVINHLATAQQQSAMLQPGQQASVSHTSPRSQISVQTVNTEAAIAWKNELIQLEGNEIHAVMRKIARWYDVEVEYRGSVPDVHFRGVLPSNVPVSQVLDWMEKTGEVHFAVSGRKIIVTP